MSVINTMLKDLERRQGPNVAGELPVPELQYQQVKPSKLPWILLGFVVFFLLLGGWFAWQKVELLTRDNQQLNDKIIQNVAQHRATEQSNEKVTEPQMIDVKQPAVVGDKPTEQAKVLPKEQAVTAVEVVKVEPKQDSTPVTDTEVITKQLSPTSHEATDTVEKPSIKAPSVKPSPVKEQVVKSTPAKANSGAMAITEVKLSPQELAKKRFDLAKAQQAEGKMQQALKNFSEALKFNPAMHQARRHLAALYYGQNMLNEAESVLQQGLALYPQEYDYALLLAKLYQSANLSDKALQSLAKISDTHRLAKDKWTMQSYLAQQTEQFSLAEQSYRYLVGVEPEQARWWMGLAYALDSQSQFSAAKQAYQQALTLKGLSSQASAFIQDRLAQLGDIE